MVVGIIIDSFAVSQKLGNDCTIAPDVCFVVVILASYDVFWCPVVSRTNVRGKTSLGLVAALLAMKGSGPTKVTKLDLARMVNQDVFWCQISVDDTS